MVKHRSVIYFLFTLGYSSLFSVEDFISLSINIIDCKDFSGNMLVGDYPFI